ncbi:MAG: hypothetical protein MUF00_09475 [Gemmatimonadaceae bacterium]|jgi:hypothetical protein|nr:hypothetical protein [Gemmatimonadaceae bacterium]
MHCRLAALLTCVGLLAAPLAAQSPQLLTFTAMDFAFRAPPTARAGLATVRLVNAGTKLHHVQLVRLGEGKTVRDLIDAWRARDPFPAWAVGMGGPTAAWKGQTLEATVVLEPGRYGVVCWVPAPDGQLHLMKGMFATLEVTGSAGAATLPKADATITLFDYNYQVTGALSRTTRAVRVENKGPQTHELVLVRLAPGKSPLDAAKWAEGGQVTDPPGEMVAGVSGLAPGRAAVIRPALRSGRYALVCFVPDAKSAAHKAHVELGMMKEIVVQ